MSFLESDSLPLPLEPLPDNKIEDRRLWLGNLDPRITEYQLIKLLQHHGAIEKFDLLFHRSGALSGQPRGYAFVTFTEANQASRARCSLDGKMVGHKRMVVRWANSVGNDELANKPKPELEIPVLAGAKSNKAISSQTKIEAIEAKLKMMENSASDDFEVTDSPLLSALCPVYQYRPPTYQATTSRYRGRSRYDSRPYRRPQSRR